MNLQEILKSFTGFEREHMILFKRLLECPAVAGCLSYFGSNESAES